LGAKEKVTEIRDWYSAAKAERTLEGLRQRGFLAEYSASSNEAKERVLNIIPPEASIGAGGSFTLLETGILDALRDRGNPMIIKTAPGKPSPEATKERRDALTADVFLTGCNAIVEDGRLVNIDGTANRVSALAFGPKQVIVIAGTNKIVGDLDAALWRVRFIAAPMNAKRLGLNTPCAQTGVCSDCTSPERICNVVSIIERRPTLSDIRVILVGEDLGL
jgi:hypothetical protein